MSSIDSLNSSLYFSAAANVSKETQKRAETEKTKSKRTSFSSMVEKQNELDSLASLGLPLEIAGMNTEDAFVFLKDEIDVTADDLSENMTAENFARFRKSVSQFMKFLEKNNYEVKTTKRGGRERVHKGLSPFFAEMRKPDPYIQVKVINKKLEELATMILQNHEDKLKMMAKLDEIKGMIVDFYAG